MSFEIPARKPASAPSSCGESLKARHDQRDHLQPEAHFVDARDRIEDRLQPSAQLAIAAVVETLKIDLVEIDPWPQYSSTWGVALPLDT